MKRTLKKIIKNTLPYGFVRFVQQNKNLHKKKKPAYGWFGHYNSYEEVAQDTEGYDADNILKTVSESLLKVKNGEAVYERDSVIFDHIEYSFPLLTALLKASNNLKGRLHVTDFGGSLGSSYYQNRNMLNNVSELRWNIIEQPNFVQEGKSRFEDNVLHFYFNFDEALAQNKPDLLLLSSVLPYLKEPYTFCETLSKYKFRYIVIDRTFINPVPEDRLTLQKVPSDIYRASYPAYLLHEQTLLDIFLKNYSLVYEFKDFISSPTGFLKAYDPDIDFACKGYFFELKEQ